MTKSLDGPRRGLPPGSARSLVVLLHGYGASGDDLIGLGDAWSSRLRHAAFVAPHAPERLPGGHLGGYQWFDLTFRDPGELKHGTDRAAPILAAYLRARLEEYRLPASRLALVGFSQGTMMALRVGLEMAAAPAALIGYSGVLADIGRAPAAYAAKPPTMLVHGSEDEVIPVGALHATAAALAASEVPVEWHERPGLGHGIDEAGLTLGASFLHQYLG